MGFSRQEHWSGLPFPSPGVKLQTNVCVCTWLGRGACWRKRCFWSIFHVPVERQILSTEHSSGLWWKSCNIWWSRGRSLILFFLNIVVVVAVQLLSYVWLFETPWKAACQASLPFTISWSLFKLMSIESMMPATHVILCHPLLLLRLACLKKLWGNLSSREWMNSCPHQQQTNCCQAVCRHAVWTPISPAPSIFNLVSEHPLLVLALTTPGYCGVLLPLQVLWPTSLTQK